MILSLRKICAQVFYFFLQRTSTDEEGGNMTIKPNLTIDDIARELGVSKTTVSRAISGKGRISVATRERVQAYIELHNYRPSAAAKGLAESKTYNLAVVMPKEFINLDIPFVRQSMSAICEEASDLGYNVMICLTTDYDASHLTRTLDHRKVDGVILTRTVENDPLLEILLDRGFPFATLGSLPAKNQGSALVEADHDQVAGCYAFTRAILGSSREKIALLANDLNYIVNQNRLAGFRRACQELGLPVEHTPVRIGINDPEACKAAVEELLSQGIRRFVCTDEDVCIRAYRALKNNGISIPEDVELSSLSDSETLTRLNPEISALRFDAAELARAACRELIHAINDQPYDAKPILGYQLMLRGSTK